MFVEKLKSKNQNAFQQGQAQKAVRLYYSGISRKGPVPPPLKDNSAPVDSVMEETQAFNLDEKNTPLG